MTLQLSRPIASVDVETTGVIPIIDRIVKVGIAGGRGRTHAIPSFLPRLPRPPERTGPKSHLMRSDRRPSHQDERARARLDVPADHE